MRELIIHVGYGKCASSSIQGFLTNNPLIDVNGQQYCYAGFSGHNLLTCEQISGRANFPPRYINTNLSKNIDGLKKQLRTIWKVKNKNFIISNEGLANPNWLNEDRFKLFADLEIPIRIFMVIRPFADWLNASWWQWGCWGDTQLDAWLNSFSISQYKKGLSQWLRLPNVIEHKVIDISEQPVKRFADFVGIEYAKDYRLNTASSADLLRFLITHKNSLDRTTHKPRIEFILNEEISVPGSKPPYVVSQIQIEKTFEDYDKHILPLFKEKIDSNVSVNLQTQERYHSKLSYSSNGDEFSMERFLNEPYEYDFLDKISKILVNRLGNPP